ncbi:MAG: xanthine dehydrogenase family protein molybdopterin-binding subunit [Pseudomonadota bacterium]
MNQMKPIKFGLGASVLRKEDDGFITGKGTYTDDKFLDGVLHGYVLRSPMAHAKFKINDISEAQSHPGVHLVLVANDVKALNPVPCVASVKQPDGTTAKNRDIPILCEDTVRHVGDAICFIVAESTAIAKDAAELIDIDFEILPAIADTASALEEDAVSVYDDGNLAFSHFSGDQEATDNAFAKADHITQITLINQRLVCNYMEPRACLAYWDDEKQRYDLTTGSQGVFVHRRVISGILKIDPTQLHVTTPDVGGGFGTKLFVYREYPLCLVAAKELGRPVKWTGERTEHFVSDAHGRDNVITARMAMDKDGRFLAIDVDLIAAMGAYLHAFGPFIPQLCISMTTGLYDIPVMAAQIRGSYTHTVPVDAYRGAGRPEAAYMIERLVDKCARDIGVSPDEIRARNLIKPEQLPYTTPPGRMIDVGEFDKHMDECMQRAEWDTFSSRATCAKANRKFRGIGMATYIEACAFAGGEPAKAELREDGTIDIIIATQSNGQGHATAYTQLAAEKLGLDIAQVNLRQGDSDQQADGGHTGGSRSLPLGGVSVVRASEELAEKIKHIAADELEASSADIELSEGEARIIGTDRVISFADIATAAPEPAAIRADALFKQEEATYPNGTHICEVEIDPDTGKTEIIRYTVVDDFGVTINPILLAGQVHGGIVQGIGQCLNENTVYDEEGQLLTASFMDYEMPRADGLPMFDFSTRNVPSTTNALGIKGAGEAGTIGSTPAVMNAISDALFREYKIEHIDMPATPAKLWSTIQTKRS